MLKAESLAEFYSCCERCGRMGYERHGFPDEPECERCLPLRVRVGRDEAAWLLHFAMVKLGRLPDPFSRRRRRSQLRSCEAGERSCGSNER